MKFIGFIFVIFFIYSCGKGSPRQSLKFYPVSKESFSKFINKKDLREQRANLAEDVHLVNNDYPIEISLYDDGKWFYNLDNLGAGRGEWKYKEGRIELYAKRSLFDMYIDVESENEEATNLIIKFSDRHGAKVLKMENRNLIK